MSTEILFASLQKTKQKKFVLKSVGICKKNTPEKKKELKI